MGGNVSVMSLNGEEVQAKKVDLKRVGRSNFKTSAKQLFEILNVLYKAKFNRSLWPNSQDIQSTTVFNGSTSFVLSDDFTDDEILKVKPSVGDIDIACPEETKENVFLLLHELRGKHVTSTATFIGMNRTSVDKLGNQINCVFKFHGSEDYLVQVDFEFLPFEGGSPTEWAKFSHSSSFKDAQAGVKAVHHKYLIRAMIGAISVRDDIVIATPKSTPDNIRLSKINSGGIRFLKFSVDRGVRVAYQPMYDEGRIMMLDGKKVYQEIPTKESTYKQTLKEIYTLAFGDPDVEKKEVQKLWDFQGVLDLMLTHLNKKALQITASRYFDLLWGYENQRAQELERNNPDLDLQVKLAGWNLFCKKLKIPNPPKFEELLQRYYEGYRVS